MPKKKKVFVAMSGGVDSSVAALLLKKKGYDVTGIFMRCYNVDGCAEQDAEDARRVAEKIGIPFYVWDFEQEYKNRVVQYMVDGYRKGLTPNPDVMCNKEIKFGLFFDKARSLGADYVATGHYVRLARKNVAALTRFARPATRSLVLAGSPLARKRADHAEPTAGVSDSNMFSLSVAKDINKDQSYFLWTLTQEQLKYCLFPIGDYLKLKVREIARKAELPTAEKKDSQGICFLGKVTLQDFLKEYIPEKRGAVLSVAGAQVGEHAGAQFYTIGQRHIGVATSNAKPLYVTEKNIKKNTLTVAEGNDHPALYKKEIELAGLNFVDLKTISLIRANKGYKILARVRYRQPLAEAELRAQRAKEKLKLVFKKPQKFVAAGQSAVFYSKKGELLGGGIIL